MLEIDTVQRALEHHPCYDIVDELSDIYEDTIDLATRPRPYLSEAHIASISRRRQFLDDRQDFITKILESNQDLVEAMGEKGSVVEAYLSTLAQVDEIIGIN